MITAAIPARARITKIQITAKESPTFGGYSWPGVGQYEKIVGKAYGELDPNDPKNSVIVDLKLAPRNAKGRVEYSFDFYILKPVDLSKGNHKVLYEPPNRGRKTIAALNRGVGGDDPGIVKDPALLADSFLMPQGYSIVFSGWDVSAGTNNARFNTTITLPVAKNPDGSTITGPSYEYIVNAGASYELSYPTATLDPSKATLTHRVHLDDKPEKVPGSGWQYNADGTAIELLPAGTPFVRNDIYEFSYTAKDPTVNGVGFAVVRDWNAWLRYESKDDSGNPNPLAGDIKRIYTEVVSQPGRFLNDFTLSWVQSGRKRETGLRRHAAVDRGGRRHQHELPLVAARANRAQPSGPPFCRGTFSLRERFDHRPNHWQNGQPLCKVRVDSHLSIRHGDFFGERVLGEGCFADDDRSDGQEGSAGLSLYAHLFHVQHAARNRQWRVARRLPAASESSGLARRAASAVHGHGQMGHGRNASAAEPVSEALGWHTRKARSVFHRISSYTRRHVHGFGNDAVSVNYGPNFYATGIPANNPPIFTPPYQDNPANGPIYPSYVPKTDADGNDIAGIRLPEVQVPLATYTGWALRAAPQNDDGCEGPGQYIPFPKTKADRIASGDPRLSIEERYGNIETYSAKLRAAIDNLVRSGYLLPFDAERTLSKNLNNVTDQLLLPNK